MKTMDRARRRWQRRRSTRVPPVGERAGAYCAALSRYARACSTSASKSAASSPASGCHWTPTAKRSDGSSTASSVPSAAHADSTSPSPTRPSALVVVGSHLGARDRRSTPSRDPSLTSTGCTANSPRHLLVIVVPDLLGQVLDEVSPTRDVQQLESAADRERRQVALERRLQQRQLARVATRLRRVRLRVRVCSVACRIDVGTSGEHDSVERVERLLDVLLGRRDDEGTSARLLDRVDVRERDERGRKVPYPPARLLGVRRDPDDAASCRLRLHDPECAVCALERVAVSGLAAHTKDAHGLAVETP